MLGTAVSRAKGSSFWGTGLKQGSVGYASRVCCPCATTSAPRRNVTRGTPSLTSLRLSIRLCAAGTATSNMLTGSHLPQSTALFAAGCGRCCAGRSTDRAKDDAYAITNNGRMPSSLTLGCSRCLRPIAWRANPDADTTDWRARRGRTAQRVRREGTAVAVPYPYPPTRSRPTVFSEAVVQRIRNYRNGSVKAKVEPLPTWLLTQIFPPCSSMNLREMA